MSATIQIARIIKDISRSQFKTWQDLKDFEEKNIYEKIHIDEKGKKYTIKIKRYKFVLFTNSKYNNHRLKRQIIKIHHKYRDYFIDINDEKYLLVEPLLWRQGWFFKKKFFNNRSTLYYADNKKHMIRLLNQFIDAKSRDTRGIEAYRACIDTFKDSDNMLFELGW